MTELYQLFNQNLNINPNINFEMVKWTVSEHDIDIVKTYVDTVVHANPYTFYVPHMENVSPDLKVFNVLELRTKC